MPAEGRYVATTPALGDKDISPLRLDSTGRLVTSAVAVDSNGNPVTTQSVAITDQTTNGTLTGAGQAVTLSNLVGLGTVGVQVSGTFVATVIFESTIDGTNWFAINAVPLPSGVNVATAATAPGQWQIDVAACTQMRVRCSAYTSGTATVFMRGGQATSVTAVALDTPIPAGANSIGSVISTVDTGALVTLTAAAAGLTTADQTNAYGSSLKLVVDITGLTGTTPTLTVVVQGKDTASGKYYNILSSTALAAVGTTVLTIGPGLPTTANLSANDVLPRTWRVVTTVGGTTPAVTATVGASVILG